MERSFWALGKSVEVRQAAGLLLKNNLRVAFRSMSPSSQQYIKSQLLPCIGAADKTIRSTAGTVISVIVQCGRILGWPDLLEGLIRCLDSNDLNHMEGAMDAIFKFFRSPHSTLRRLSLGSINQFIVIMPTALLLSMDQYLQGLFLLARDISPDVRKLVCSAFVQLIEVRSSILEPHLRNVIEYMLQANNDSDDEVALEACEFWSAYCDANLPPEGLRDFLPRLIPVLLSNMVYADDDESLVDAEDDDTVPDRDEDLKPRFHSSRLHGPNNGEDPDDGIVNVWNLRKCSAAGLDVLSVVYGDEILPTLMPLIQLRLSTSNDSEWKDRRLPFWLLVLSLRGVLMAFTPCFQSWLDMEEWLFMEKQVETLICAEIWVSRPAEFGGSGRSWRIWLKS
ncbi:hypothetical protein HPP92_006865 [Vanilla planifolia]|uniref:Importin N-terminal domain-containing protein n=1 Tax=Vanilla planifolia TaxID=51239 RepID=A0A835RFK2_VANPL|nr:hypothetical protein HPP92_006865 [Vanilla planifolia]